MNEQTTTYNGWTNHETWLASIWLGSEPSSYAILLEAKTQPGGANARAEWLSEQVRASFQTAEHASLFTDLIQAGLHRINWLEIIEDN